MKKLLTTLGICVAILVLSVNTSFGQEKVTEKKLLGTWLLVIDVEEELEEAEREMEDEDNIIGEIVLQGVSGLVEGIMDNIEIYFEFLPDGEVNIIVEAFGERETEYARWEINSRGELYIDDTDRIQYDDDDYWLMDGRYLVVYEDGRSRSENVYMRRVD